MPIVVGVDLGTTKITSVAVDRETSAVLAIGTVANDANLTAPADRVRGYSEWDARLIVTRGCESLKQLSAALGSRIRDVTAIGLTGQQHGMLLVDKAGQPLSPLINWQDRRALELRPETGQSWLDETRSRLGSDCWKRTGCRLQPGFLAGTLYWLQHQGRVPAGARALMIMEHFAAELTGQPAVSEPSCAGSAGVFDVHRRDWDAAALASLDLPRSLFPEVREADQPLGPLTRIAAERTGLPGGIPVFPPIGDHQASFLGSVANRDASVLVNVGTGAQVAVYTDQYEFVPPVELRPFPIRGNLLSNVGLAGGWSYQVLEQFFRTVGQSVFGLETPAPLYETLTRLAATIPEGSDGLACDPVFAGTRWDPARRGQFTGVSPQNFTAAHFVRAVLEGMGRSLHEGALTIEQITHRRPTVLVAAGNGLRENPLLADIVSNAFGLPLTASRHREEAACGAARIAAGDL